ncbi:epidermis-specific secreted glycoprotein EP1-like [Malania oleifera]|uniref:epidermis-specific secreted glycoprotein EP1-like n=1 Tax=Malania oleifera TaxID=397392 RepID=UPI0025ADDC98|nr:epidermis-specific secreted glycoprotein EP1-like [Malania oleifera]
MPTPHKAVTNMTTPALLLLLLLIFSINAEASSSVPPSNTFTFVNDGEFGPYVVEYDAYYRVLPLAASPFQLCFYNTTPDAFTLALRMGTTRSESLFRWVWEANRATPVRHNATFSLRPDGNLVLADADGRVVWQSATAHSGVVGFKILPIGNMVLYDSDGKYVWQSFDHPTDTLLVGQSLRVGGSDRLVSRVSDSDNSEGPYSLVLEPKRLALYYKSETSPKPFLYYEFVFNSKLENITFDSHPETDEAYAFDITWETSGVSWILARPKYNSTLSFIRVGSDGNVRIYTFYDNVDWGAWEETYTLFSRESREADECQLPERCGRFGLCEDSQCVGCPTPKGLKGWSKECGPLKVGSCGAKEFEYYKMEGVDHFMSKYSRGSGPVKEEECRMKCSKDCKCLGYFYHRVGSRCWIAYDLKTLTRVTNSTHLGFIKAPTKH